jgi:RimJ/RimL family protein N-acetyltransferase
VSKSYGVIDKNNTLNIRHEAPLIGMIAFEPHTVWNGYLHIASSRKAWGSGLFDQGLVLAIDDIFSSIPSLTRISALVLENNYPTRSLAKRMGFLREGRFEDMVTQHGEPRSLLHFGMTRRRWTDGVLQEDSEAVSADRS